MRSRRAAQEIIGGSETAAYLVKYDSVHGIWGKEVESKSATEFTVDGKSVSFSEEKDFTKVDWKSKGVEMVIDCTGEFLTVEKLMPYLDVCGVKRVVVSAPVKEKSVLDVYATAPRTDGHSNRRACACRRALPWLHAATARSL